MENGRMTDDVENLRSAYRAFNARDIEAALELMHPDVDWPNAWEGGRVLGRAAVREYWTRQFAAISSHVEPEAFDEEPDGSITVAVHQVVRDPLGGEPISDTRVRHRYRLADGLSFAWTSLNRLASNEPVAVRGRSRARGPQGSRARRVRRWHANRRSP